MGEKFPYIQFYTGDWLKDPSLTLCSPCTRGIWIDVLCAMHELGRSGELRGTTEQLARVARCSTRELTQALDELSSSGAATIERRNDLVTITNRRMKRENDYRRKAAERQRNHRLREDKGRDVDKDDGDKSGDVAEDVTPLSRDDNALYSYSTSDSVSDSENNIFPAKKKSGLAAKTAAPKSFEITEFLRNWAKPLGIDDLEGETEAFLDWHRSHSTRFSDWPAAWRNWMRNKVKWEKERKNGATKSGFKAKPNVAERNAEAIAKLEREWASSDEGNLYEGGEEHFALLS